MFSSFHDQVCIVTGASSGIGAAFAHELDQHGAHLVLFARRAENLERVAASLKSDVLVVVGDLTQSTDRARLVDETLAHFGRVDVLINNAGRGEGSVNFAALDAETIEAVMQTNLLGVIHLTRAVVPHMIAHKHGLIINVSSPMGHLGLPSHSLYTVSKAGLSAFSQSLSRELVREGIHVMDLRPGFTYSEMITPERATHLPRIEPVKTAEAVVQAALKAALKGKPDLMTAGIAARLAVWLNRWLPRLTSKIIKRVGL